MQLKTKTLIAAVVAAFVAQGALAADAKKKAAAATECLDAAEMPKAKSDKSRADVKATAKAGSGECDASPAAAAKSTKSRTDVKAETKAGMKSGEVGSNEGTTKPSK